MFAQLASVPLQAGTIVMATGIVAIGLSRIRLSAVGTPLLAIAAVVWLLLLLSLAARALLDSSRLLEQLHAPSALSLVAGTAVLGSGLGGLGWLVPAVILLLLAAALMALVATLVLSRWQTPTRGVSFLLAVATASLGALAAELAGLEHAPWLLVPSGVGWVLAVLAYLFVVSRFDLREVVRGRGDHWVAGGALAIATLLGAEFCLGLRVAGHPYSGAPELAATAIWAIGSVWTGVLLVTELTHVRLFYDHLRWATVFPLGMYGAASLALGGVLGSEALLQLGRVFIWIGLGAWLLVATGLLARLAGLRSSNPPDAPSREPTG
ncbi:MAG: hypothetical protein ACRENY_04995 [Candidatus Dormibacteria bacterium]